MKLAGLLRVLASVGAGLAVFLLAAATQGAHSPDLRTLLAVLLAATAALATAMLLSEGALGSAGQALLFLAPVAALGVAFLCAAERAGTLDALGALAPLLGLLAFGHGTGSLGRERTAGGGGAGELLRILAAAAVAALAIGVAGTLHLPGLTYATLVLLGLGLVLSAGADAVPAPVAQALASPGLSALVLLPCLAALEHPFSLLPPFPAAGWLLVGGVFFCAGWVEGRFARG